MRLIDADALMDDLYDMTVHNSPMGVQLANYLAPLVEQQPTVDPVHAAGGCYCWECKSFFEYSDEYKKNDKNAVEGADGDCFFRAIHSEYRQFYAVQKNDFCSYGRREESRCEKD